MQVTTAAATVFKTLVKNQLLNPPIAASFNLNAAFVMIEKDPFIFGTMLHVAMCLNFEEAEKRQQLASVNESSNMSYYLKGEEVE